MFVTAFATRRSVKLHPADTMRTTLLFLLLLRTCQFCALSRASVTVSPSTSQHPEFGSFLVICEHFSSDEWTVWRYTNGLEPVLSQCGNRWGDPTSSACEVTAIKKTDSGVYWCQSRRRDSSDGINITVTRGAVILQSPVLPVMEGDDVTLHCQTDSKTDSKTDSGLSNHTAAFYKDGSLIRTELTGHMTIYHVSKSDESAYKCRNSEHEESPTSWLLMKDDSAPASLTVTPSSSQLFQYDDLSLNCGENSSLHGWKVFRSVRPTNSGGELSIDSCGAPWGETTHFGCKLFTVKKGDSGIYWCESLAKQRSNLVDITVNDGPLILQSPALPVMEGDNVTLHCKTDNQANSDHTSLPAAFYKDGSLIRTEPTGHMTIYHVSVSDEGLYKCHISSYGESPSSWLFVRDPRAPSTADQTLYLLRLIRHLVVLSPYCISTVLMVSLYRHRPAGGNPPVSMTTSPPGEDDERLDPLYDDVTADVTTEHHF